MTENTTPIENQNRQKYWVLLSIGVGTFMSALDGSIVNTILPVLRNYFDSDIATIEWTVVIYLLVLSAFLLTSGRAGDLHGHKKIYVSGFVIFIISSALCGFVNSAVTLVVFRAIQALGASMLAANSPAILTGNFPAEQRGQALGMQATMTYLGLTIGPSLGGMLAQYLSWRSVFYINIPVGLIALLLSLKFIPSDRPDTERKERFDVTGAATFSFGLVLLLLAMNQGHAWGWSSLPILSLLAVAVITLVGFIIIEQKKDSPMLDIKLFYERTFSAATTSATLNYISLYSITFLMPFYLQQGRGFTPAQTGLILTAQPLMMAIAAPLSGFLSDRVGTRTPAIAGLAILATGLYLLSTIDAATGVTFIAISLAVAGLGIGIFISPNSSALMGAAPKNRQGIASGVLATARSLGMVLGVGLSGAILTSITANAPDSALFKAVQVGFLAAMTTAILGSLSACLRRDDRLDKIEMKNRH